MNYLKVSLMNVKRNKKTSIQTIILISVLTILISTFFIYSLSINSAFALLSSSKQSANNIKIVADKQLYENEDIINQIESQNINELIFNANALIIPFSSEILFEIDNINYKLKSALMLKFIDKIPENEKKEFDILYENIPLIKYGRMPANDQEIICSELVLSNLGISDIDNVINKSITISYSNDNISIKNFIIVGVIDNNYYNLEIFGGDIIPEIILPFSNIYNIDNNNVFYYIDIYFNSFFDQKDTLIFLEKILNDQYSLVKNDTSIFKSLEAQSNLIKNIYSILGLIVIIAIFINMIYILYNNINKGDHYGVLKASGFRSKDTWFLLILELLYLYILSLIISIVMIIALIFLINSYINKYIVISLFSLISLNTFLITIMVGLLIIIIASLITTLIYYKKSPYNLMNIKE